MKKRKKSISIDLAPVRLFWEDIKAIENIFKEYCEKLKIQTEDYEFDSIEELKNLGKDKVRLLTLGSQAPHITVTFEPSSARIYSDDDDVKSVGIISKLKNILEKRITPLSNLVYNWIILSIIVSLPFIFLLLFPEKEKKIFPIILLIMIWIMIFYSKWVSYFTGKRHSVIYLISRKSKKNIFSRNKEKIILGAINLIIGGLVTFFVLYLTGKIK